MSSKRGKGAGKPKQHLINPLHNLPIEETIERLVAVRGYLVDRARRVEVSEVPAAPAAWALAMKRLSVQLDEAARPEAIGKPSESFIEVINILATLEHLISALRWFNTTPVFDGWSVSECHPSTSDDETSNDVVLKQQGAARARVEAFDIVSANRDGNRKEHATLSKLLCGDQVPADDTRRFVATSRTFGEHLRGEGRKWKDKHYQYEMVWCDGSSCVLEIVRGELERRNPKKQKVTP